MVISNDSAVDTQDVQYRRSNYGRQSHIRNLVWIVSRILACACGVLWCFFNRSHQRETWASLTARTCSRGLSIRTLRTEFSVYSCY
ncbi:hypothetical protein BDW68DRAFT_167085 [Aspergillus falconensis]